MLVERRRVTRSHRSGAGQTARTDDARRMVVAVSDGGPDGPDLDGRPFMAPRLEMACHVAMCVTMGYMLILML